MWYHATSHDEGYYPYIQNIARRFGFRVEEEDGIIFKVTKTSRTVLLEKHESKPSKRWWSACRKLVEEYNYSGRKMAP